MENKKLKKDKEKELMINSWRMLYYGGLLNEKESENIKKKINTKYGIV